MKKKYITYKGIIHFDPVNKTKKHESQADWKRMAMIMLEDEYKDATILENGKPKYIGITSYYNWFLNKRYNINLNKPLRGSHISFINDSIRDIMKGMNCSQNEAIQAWEQLKTKWNGKEIEIYLDPDIRSDGDHWWLIVPQEKREEIHNIRKEIGLGRPYFGLHMSIGYANQKNIEQSKYILKCIKNGFIN